MTVHADGSITERRYWRPEYNFDAQRSRQDTVEAIDEAVRDSVRYHNVADVEVGSFLSSGIDSSYMAACLAKENPDIKTFTVGFDCYKNAAANNAEGAGGRCATRSRGPTSLPTNCTSPTPTSTSAKTSTGRACLVCSGTWTSRPPTLRRGAVLRGPDRGKEGQGGAFRRRRRRVLRRLPHLPDAVRQREAVLGPEEPAARRLQRHARWASAARTTWSARARPPRIGTTPTPTASPSPWRSAPSCCAAAAGVHPQQLTSPVYAEVKDLDETTRMQYVDLYFWLVGDILLKTDKMSMAHSLESRVPFLDRRVFDVSATIPTPLKANGDANEDRPARGGRARHPEGLGAEGEARLPRPRGELATPGPLLQPGEGMVHRRHRARVLQHR